VRVKLVRAVVAVAFTLVSGAAISMTGIAFAQPACPPDERPCRPDPDDTPPPTGDGHVIGFRVVPDACEPRLTPWNQISYRAPGADHTVVYVSAASNGSYTTVLSSFGGNSVSFRHQSHGTYLVRSFDSQGQILGSATAFTC
jgi:hypothetical protein